MIPQEISDSLIEYFSKIRNVSIQISDTSSLSGGCINHVHRVETSIGDFCIKYNLRDRYPDMFTSEADGLASLKKAGKTYTPEVICTGEAGLYAYILLEFIEQGRRKSSFMQDFGRSLGQQHRVTTGYFGNTIDNYMGSIAQSNKQHPDWTSFFVEERLKKQVSLAHEYFSPSDLASFDRLYARLKELLPEEPPALLHGDLWGGNYMVGKDGKACLIDPAVYYGHREIDIAMTSLFGGFDESFYASYQEEYPMEKGWQKRLDILNLYPLLIHLNLFGSGYLGSITSIIRRF
jgi:fructosamine-3-kinase